eukprot:TRINITY_DN13031_c0_g1_i1.p1 TRINITY_DN13031_c0_g1~~TRINITY_DN13031_c0_g1_i1.p1  ORF type:complete len:1179 (+),score=241.91 TRINITY_DN13031_c0_g1_i1:60-3539(+)
MALAHAYDVVTSEQAFHDTIALLNNADAVALDLEGYDLGRIEQDGRGKIGLIQVCGAFGCKLIDVVALENENVDIMSEGGGLKGFLENPDITKYMYGCPTDCDALHDQYNVRVKNILDLQLLCIVKEKMKKPVNSLKSLAAFLKENKVSTDTKDPISERMKTSGSAFWVERPLPDDCLAYAAADVKTLWDLKRIIGSYKVKLGKASEKYSQTRIDVKKNSVVNGPYVQHGYLPLGVCSPPVKGTEEFEECTFCTRRVHVAFLSSNKCFVCKEIDRNTAPSQHTRVIKDETRDFNTKESRKVLERITCLPEDATIEELLGSNSVSGARPLDFLREKMNGERIKISDERLENTNLSPEEKEKARRSRTVLDEKWYVYQQGVNEVAAVQKKLKGNMLKVFTFEKLDNLIKPPQDKNGFKDDHKLFRIIEDWNPTMLKSRAKPLDEKHDCSSFDKFCKMHLRPIVTNFKQSLQDGLQNQNTQSFQACRVPEVDVPEKFKGKVVMKGTLPVLDYSFTNAVVLLAAGEKHVRDDNEYLAIARVLDTSLSKQTVEPVMFTVSFCGTAPTRCDLQRFRENVTVTALESLTTHMRSYGACYSGCAPAFASEFSYNLDQQDTSEESDWDDAASERGMIEDSSSGSSSDFGFNWFGGGTVIDEREKPPPTRSACPVLPSPHEANTKGLDKSQKAAVDNYLTSTSKVHIIEGPPGTGKTKTLTGIVLNTPRSKDHKILVTAPSNAAVQVIAKALLREGINDFMLNGVADAVPDELKAHSPDVASRDAIAWCRKAWKSIEAKRIVPVNDKKSMLDLSKLLEELYEEYCKQRKVVLEITHCSAESLPLPKPLSSGTSFECVKHFRENLYGCMCRLISVDFGQALDEAPIVMSTLVSAGRPGIMRLEKTVRLMLVDEAAQALEQDLMIPFRLLPASLMLVGDVKQLGGIGSQEFTEKGYCESTMERLLKKGVASSKLSTQYRMHPDIQQFPRDCFYKGYTLEADKSVLKRGLLKGLPPVSFHDLPTEEGKLKPESKSFVNHGELQMVMGMLCHLVPKLRHTKKTVGVITFYKDQATLIREHCLKSGLSDVRVNTVDSFQGGEHDVILLSFVRSNENHDVGFLDDARRLNVALTRAKQAMVAVGNLNTLQNSRSPSLCSFAEDVIKRNLVLHHTQ